MLGWASGRGKGRVERREGWRDKGWDLRLGLAWLYGVGMPGGLPHAWTVDCGCRLAPGGCSPSSPPRAMCWWQPSACLPYAARLRRPVLMLRSVCPCNGVSGSLTPRAGCFRSGGLVPPHGGPGASTPRSFASTWRALCLITGGFEPPHRAL